VIAKHNLRVAYFGKYPPHSVRDAFVDNKDYDENHQNEYPIGNFTARYRCFSAEPFHGIPPQIDRLTWAISHASNDITDFQKPIGYAAANAPSSEHL
jgi:hypothetical protein